MKECAPSGRRRRNRRSPGCVFERLLCPGSSASPWFTASCCRDGSLADIQPLWVQKTSEVPPMFEGVATAHTFTHSTSNACTSLGRHCNTTRPYQSSCFVFVLLVTYMRSSELLALRKNDLVPPLAPLLPCWSIVIAASETGVSTRTGIRDESVVMDQLWLQWVNMLLPALKAGNSEEQIWNFDHPAAANIFKAATGTLALNGMTMYQTRHSGASIDRVRCFSTLQEVQRRGQWKAFSSVTCVEAVISPPRLHTSCSPKSYFRQCCHSKLASSCSQTLDSGTSM